MTSKSNQTFLNNCFLIADNLGWLADQELSVVKRRRWAINKSLMPDMLSGRRAQADLISEIKVSVIFAAIFVVPISVFFGVAYGLTLWFLWGWFNYLISSGRVVTGYSTLEEFEARPTSSVCLPGSATLQQTDGATKKLSELCVGDSVLAWDEREEALRASIITEIDAMGLSSLVKIELSGKTFKATGSHAVRTRHGWCLLGEVSVGDYVLAPRCGAGSWSRIAAVSTCDEIAEVFSIRTRPLATPLVDGVVTHNRSAWLISRGLLRRALNRTAV